MGILRPPIGVKTVHPQLSFAQLSRCVSIRFNSNQAASNAEVQSSLKKYMRWYPFDSVTCANIETFTSLRKHLEKSQQILIAVMYENATARQTSRLIETLLADPLSAHSADWYSELNQRSKIKNNLISHSDVDMSALLLPESFRRASNTTQVPSPILSGEHRSKFLEVLGHSDSPANDIILVEINEAADAPKLLDVCHFYICITNEFASIMDSVSRSIQKKILLTVVDNKEYSPRSNELTEAKFTEEALAHHVIKVDSNKLARGIEDFYEYDVKASSEYFELLQLSNIIEVGKLLLWYTRTENLCLWLFEVIRIEIGRNNLSEKRVQEIYEDLRLQSISRFSKEMHAELQDSLMPQTSAFLSKKIPWWKLYWYNDNVEYMVKDFFSSTFMTKSIDAYNYVRGQLVARLQEQKFAKFPDETLNDNPLAELKHKYTKSPIPTEVQLMVYRCLATGFMYYQLPLTILSAFGYTLFGIGGETALAMTILGWTLGFNHVAREWHAYTTKFMADLHEDVRLTISKGCLDNGLLKELATRYEGAKDLARIKRQVLEVLGKGKRHFN